MTSDNRSHNPKLQRLFKVKEGEIGELPERTLKFPRSCKSAELPPTPKVSVQKQVGLEDDIVLDSFVPSRSHSVIDDTKLRAYGLTLPPDEKTARLLELAGKFIAKAEKASKHVKSGEEKGDLQDEGYGSKGSSNGTENVDEDPEGSRVAHCDSESEQTNLESPSNDCETSHNESEYEDKMSLNHMHYDATGNSQEIQNDEDANRNEVPENTAEAPENTERFFPQCRVPLHNMGNGRDAIAKLMYSRRDRNIYERQASRRARDTGFRYAGKEQSRLMETSLNNITPGYLSLHQFANLSNFVQHSTNNQGQTHLGLQQEQLQQQFQPTQLQTEMKQQHDMQPKTLSLRRICLQDSTTPEFVSSAKASFQNGVQNSNNELANRKSSANDRRRLMTKSAKDIPNLKYIERFNSANLTISSKTENQNQNGAVVDQILDPSINTLKTNPPDRQTHLRINELSAHTLLPFSKSNLDPSSNSQTPQSLSSTIGVASAPDPSMATASPAPVAHIRYQHRESLCLQSIDSSKTPRTSSPTPENTARTMDSSGQNTDRLSTSCFPVADLLPAVERNIRRRANRGLGKQQQILYRSHTTLDSLPWKQSRIPTTAATSSCQDIYSSAMGSLTEEGNLKAPRPEERVTGGVPLLVPQKGHGPPGFRPHNTLSPLQRAKEIVNRRLHGHITTLPDGSETVRVSSPLYQPARMDRINSASRAQLRKRRIN